MQAEMNNATDSHSTDTLPRDLREVATLGFTAIGQESASSMMFRAADRIDQLEGELAEVKAHEAKLIASDQRMHHENMRLRDALAASETRRSEAEVWNEAMEAAAKHLESASLTYAGPDPIGIQNIRTLSVLAIRALKKADPQERNPTDGPRPDALASDASSVQKAGMTASNTPAGGAVKPEDSPVGSAPCVVGLTLKEVHAAIDAEPELPGPMPDAMWESLRDDKDAVEEAMRIAVRQTKRGIKQRLDERKESK